MVRNVTGPLVISLVLLGTARADAGPADPPKYKRPGAGTIKIDAPISDRTKPKAPKEAAPRAPELTPEELLAIQRDAGEIRQKQIDLLEQLIAATPDSAADEKADLYFRLAEAYAQRSRFERLEGTGASIDADRATKAAEKKRLTAVAKAHQANAVNALKNAIKSYQALTDNTAFKNFADLDKALFYYAFSLKEAKYAKDARTIFHRLLTDYPQSPFAPEAYLAFADYYFAAGELQNARAFYQKVLLFPSSSVYSYSNYMLGWVHLNLGEPEDAGKQFLQVIRDTAGVAKQATLYRAATKDFVRAYAEFGQVQRALAAFKKLDPAYAPTMYELLADLYVEQGKSDRAIHAYRELIKELPADAHVCLWQHDVARAMLATPGATPAQRVDEIVLLTRLHQALAGTKALPAADASECYDNAQAMACEMARAYHSEALRTKNPDTLTHADRLYDACLDVFPDADDAGESQYFHAELRWSRAEAETVPRLQTERWEEAAVAFTDVVLGRKVDAKLMKESARAAVLGWQNALAIAPRPPGKVVPAGDVDEDTPPPAAEPVPAREQKLLDAFAVYRTYVDDPTDDQRIATLFLEANILRKHHQYDRARPLLAELIEKYPGHETALYAANVLFDIEIITHRDRELGRWSTWLRDHPAFLTARADQDRAELGKRAAEIGIKVLRIDLEHREREARKSGDLDALVRCGSGYLALFNDIVKADPDAGVAEKLDELLYNAGVCFEDGRSLSAAISAFQELRDRFPDSPQSARALARLGAVYARVAYYREASAMFEEYAKKYGGQADAYQAMNDAVIYRRGLGDDVKAIENTKYFVAKFGGKNQGQAASAFFSIATILEKRGDTDGVVAHYRDYLERYGDKGGADRVVVAQARIGQILWEQSCPVASVDGSCIEVARTRAVRTASTRRARGTTRDRCGDETKARVTPIARDPRKVKAAMAAFAAAVAAYERTGGAFPGGDERTARHSYAMARFHQTEVDLEAYLRIEFPGGLDFDPAKPAAKKKSDERLAAWIEAKQKLGLKTTAAYGVLVHDVKDPTTAIAAAARAGQVSQHFADALYTAEVPAFLRPYDDAVDAYCDTLTKVAEPYEEAALDGFGACLKASTDLGWFSSWSRLCERELGQIRPERFPTSSELWAAPDEAATASDVEGAIARLE